MHVRLVISGSLIWLASFFSIPTALAGSGFEVTVPSNIRKMKNGVTMKVSTHWVEACGYRPINIDATRIPPFAAERRLRVEIKPNSWYDQNMPRRITTWIVFDEGSSKTSKTIYAPQAESWGGLRISVFEDGRKLDDLESDFQGAMIGNQGHGNLTEAFPTMLFVDSDAPLAAARKTFSAKPTYELPDISRCASLFISSTTYTNELRRKAAQGERGTDQDTINTVNQLPNIEIVAPHRLPDSWLGLTSLDVVMISLDDLKSLSEEQLRAIDDFVRSGPLLVVYGVGDELQRLSELEKLLGLASDPESWVAPKLAKFGEKINELQNAGNRYSGYVYNYQTQSYEEEKVYTVGSLVLNEDELRERQDRIAEALGYLSAVGFESSFLRAGMWPTFTPNLVSCRFVKVRDNRAIFRSRSHALGAVVAVGPEDPFAASEQQWIWMFNQLKPKWIRYRRQGFSQLRENTDFWKFLIKGVGAAPVKSYLVMISIFVFLIGPLNYWILHRNGKLFLLLLTVPLGAGLVTLALFSYALVSDGLSTRTRVRSYTLLDQENGHSISWSRQSMYSAIVPSGGLRYPEDAAVYPLEDVPTDVNQQARRDLVLDGDQQLASGYISSRTWCQLMVVQPQQTEARINVQQSGSKFTAENQLGSRIATLLVADADGKLFVGKNIREKDKANLSAINVEDARKMLREIHSENRPVAPDGSVGYQRSSFALQPTSSWTQWDSGFTAPSMSTGLLEQGISGAMNRLPKNGHYVAITAENPSTVPLGYERAVEEESLHVITGEW